MKKYNFLTLLSGAILVLTLQACNNSKEHPGYIYFPDMTYSQAYETYTDNPNFEDGMTARTPVPGTIPQGVGYTPFSFENSQEDYTRAGEELKNPVEATPENLKQGKYLYEIYCSICHGNGGEGDGNIVKRDKFPPPPSYFNEYMMSLSDGKMYFSMYYGKNMMGSYASQVNETERWQIIHYINSLQDKKAVAAVAISDTTATNQ